VVPFSRACVVRWLNFGHGFFCGRMFPMVSLFATELVEIAEGKVLIGAATHTGEASDSDIAD